MVPLLNKPVQKVAAGDTNLSDRIAALLAKDPVLKHRAQRACITYIRSIFVQKNKEVFDVRQLPVTEFALSMGLPSAPRIRMLDRAAGADRLKNQPRELLEKGSKADHAEEAAESEDDELIRPKKKQEVEAEPKIASAQKKPRRLRIDPRRGFGQRVVFDEDGAGVEAADREEVDELCGEVADRYKRLRLEMEERDGHDKVRERQRLRDKRIRIKEQPVLDGQQEE